jgi:hypothetical protein
LKWEKARYFRLSKEREEEMLVADEGKQNEEESFIIISLFLSRRL